MLKTFIRGLIFGAGFVVALIIIITLFNKFSNSGDLFKQSKLPSNESNWNEASDIEQLSKASAIAIAKFSDSDNCSRIATIENVFTDPSVNIDLKPGDIYPQLKYYPKKDGVTRRESERALIIFYNSPPIEHRTLFIYENRIIAFGDLSLEQAVAKFKEN